MNPYFYFQGFLVVQVFPDGIDCATASKGLPKSDVMSVLRGIFLDKNHICWFACLLDPSLIPVSLIFFN